MDKLKMKLKQADWWEITYLIIYGAVFTFEFLNTTMFEVKWPPRFAYIFLASTALYTVAKFIWHNTYTKKEMIWAGIILFAFIMPALLTDYRFLWYTGFLIVGAKDIDFDRILKVYLTIGITIMLAAFVASQVGWIENLQYVVERDGGLIIRNAFGSVYPTDFAAHVFYLSLAGICIGNKEISYGKIINLLVFAIFLQDKCGARTSFICLVMVAFLLVVFVTCKIKMVKGFYYMFNFTTIGCATIYILLTHLFDYSKEWMIALNGMLSNRLEITNKAIQIYSYKIFGQNIIEIGSGRTVEHQEEYFFLDDSYIRILLLYGIVLFVISLLIFWKCGEKAMQCNKIVVLLSIVAISAHSFMEHHILEIAYNPIFFFVFAKCKMVEDKG